MYHLIYENKKRFKTKKRCGNMNNSVILFYSKYSSSCKRLMTIIDNSDGLFNEIKKVCIDSQIIRNKLINSDNIKIEELPCILNIHEEGIVEKYDGPSAFNLIEETIKDNSKQILNNETPPQPVQPPPQPVQQEIVIQSKPPESGGEQGTIIDNLMELENNDRSDTIPRRAGIRTNSGNYDYDEELFNQPKPVNHQTSKRAIKDPKTENRGSDIMSVARQMEKERDQESK